MSPELSLLPAIRTFSEPAAWDEFERFLGLTDSREAHASWNAGDWARYELRLSLMLGSVSGWLTSVDATC